MHDSVDVTNPLYEETYLFSDGYITEASLLSRDSKGFLKTDKKFTYLYSSDHKLIKLTSLSTEHHLYGNDTTHSSRSEIYNLIYDKQKVIRVIVEEPLCHGFSDQQTTKFDYGIQGSLISIGQGKYVRFKPSKYSYPDSSTIIQYIQINDSTSVVTTKKVSRVKIRHMNKPLPVTGILRKNHSNLTN